MKIEIIGEWKDSLIWCPSQCYLKFKWRDLHCMLYLRWRHHDPWTATLIECPNDNFDMHEKPNHWYELPIPYFESEDDLNHIKESAINEAKDFLRSRYIN